MGNIFPGSGGPAAGFDQPLEMLAACHERIEAQLGILDRLPAHLAAHGADPEACAAAARVLRYFDEAGPKHHADEESGLFPLLDGRTELIQLLGVLREDHRSMERVYALLRPLLQAVVAGRADTWRTEIAEQFCAQYRAHIACENAHLLPVAARLLATSDRARLGAAMAARRTGPGTAAPTPGVHDGGH